MVSRCFTVSVFLCILHRLTSSFVIDATKYSTVENVCRRARACCFSNFFMFQLDILQSLKFISGNYAETIIRRRLRESRRIFPPPPKLRLEEYSQRFAKPKETNFFQICVCMTLSNISSYISNSLDISDLKRFCMSFTQIHVLVQQRPNVDFFIQTRIQRIHTQVGFNGQEQAQIRTCISIGYFQKSAFAKRSLLQKYESLLQNHDQYGEFSGTEFVHLFDHINTK